MSRRAAAPRAPQALHHAPKALHHDPLAPMNEDQILERFYRPPREPAAIPPTPGELPRELDGVSLGSARKPKPAHYKIVCISLYNDDIERLEKMVETLKRRGHTKANKSQLIRAALDQVDLDKVPKSP